MPKWYEEQGEYNDVVISSRVRLARNLKKYPFSPKLGGTLAAQMIEEIKEKLMGIENHSGQLLYSSINHMEKADRIAMLERHVISLAMVNKEQETGLFMAEDESAGIMINEEDHLRIQALTGAMNIEKAFGEANRLDDWIDKRLEIAYDEKYGYLTACPTNVGTGLRASYMIFLPALETQGQIPRLMEEAAKLGIAFRGMYGEGTKAYAGIYQISNQKTLGSTERDIIENLNNVVYQVIHKERKRREYMLKEHYNALEDQIYRAYGLLKYARQLSAEDAMTFLSHVKFGVDTGILKIEKNSRIFTLMMEIQPGNLWHNQKSEFKNASEEMIRARYLNQNLPKLME